MKAYNNVDNNAYNGNDAITVEEQIHKGPYHNLQTIRHVKKENKTNSKQLVNMVVFKPISKNRKQNRRNHNETNSNPGISSRKGKNAGIETDHNARSWALKNHEAFILPSLLISPLFSHHSLLCFSYYVC